MPHIDRAPGHMAGFSGSGQVLRHRGTADGEPLDIAGKDYALIIPGQNHEWIRDPNAYYHFLGEMDDTPYGDIRVYYTRSDPSRIRLEPKRFQFFGNRRGYVETTDRASTAPVDVHTGAMVGASPSFPGLPSGTNGGQE